MNRDAPLYAVVRHFKTAERLKTARRFAEIAADDVGFDDDAVGRIGLAAQELANNAHIHGLGLVSFEVIRTDQTLALVLKQVKPIDGGLPLRWTLDFDPADLSEDGYGMFLVCQMLLSIDGVELTHAGTVVVVSIPIPKVAEAA